VRAKDFDRKFDSGEDVSGYLDWSTARLPNLERKRVSIRMPVWMIHRLDKEAKRLGVPRQSLIKVLIARQLENVGA